MIRTPEVVVISDLHLGTYACKARSICSYLRSVKPAMLILNGDIIDVWQFTKNYFPKEHFNVIKEIIQKISDGTKVVYITGNHDAVLRRFSGLSLGGFSLEDKLALELNGEKTWIFHGDVFDHTTNNQAKLWARLGSCGLATLLAFNRFIDYVLHLFGGNRISLASKIMKEFNHRVVKQHAFEQKIAEVANDRGFQTVICGHIHEPTIKSFQFHQSVVQYLNSGDWVCNQSALEYENNRWSIHVHTDKLEVKQEPLQQVVSVLPDQLNYSLTT